MREAKIIAVCENCGNEITTFDTRYYKIIDEYFCEECVTEAERFTDSWEEL